jgi:acetyl-CoA carboxylase carboxyltransferase component
MAMKDLADDLGARREKALAMGGAEAIARQHGEGKLTVRERVARLFDPGSFQEIGLLAHHANISSAMRGKDTPADGMVTRFGKINGRPASLIAGGAFHHAVRCLPPAPGLSPGRARVHGVVEGRAAGHHPPRRQVLYAVSEATVPKVTVVVRKAYGAGYFVMCGKAYEPDLIVAWPGAEISVMGAEGAVEIIGRSAIEASDDPEATREQMLEAVRKQIDPYLAAGNAMIDDIIDPRETRPTIVRGLRMAADKRVERPWKKHGVMPV